MTPPLRLPHASSAFTETLTNTHTHTHTHTHTLTHTHTHISSHIQTHTHTHTHVGLHMKPFTPKRKQVSPPLVIEAVLFIMTQYKNECPRASMLRCSAHSSVALRHTQTHTHTHTHTHTPVD